MFWQRLSMIGSLFWDMNRVVWQLIYGAWKISRMPQPIVTIFGGSRFSQDTLYAQLAHKLAQRFVNAGFSVLTGGGPGIMEAASCGAVLEPGPGKGQSMGIGVTELNEKPNPCVQSYMQLRQFFARKWLMTRYSKAFIVFPGGFGTLDELFEVLTLIQTKNLPQAPVILVGSEYWNPFLQWLNDKALHYGLVVEHELSLFIVTDDLEQAFCVVRDECMIPLKK